MFNKKYLILNHLYYIIEHYAILYCVKQIILYKCNKRGHLGRKTCFVEGWSATCGSPAVVELHRPAYPNRFRLYRHGECCSFTTASQSPVVDNSCRGILLATALTIPAPQINL